MIESMYDIHNVSRHKKLDKWLMREINSEIMSRHILNETGYYPK